MRISKGPRTWIRQCMQHARRTQQKITRRLLTTNQLSRHKPPSPNMLAQQLLVAEAVADPLEWVALRYIDLATRERGSPSGLGDSLIQLRHWLTPST